ncbi:MAG: sulfatase-like hydrolase/transferase [Lentimicrobiaceae bacterium]|nr:sulfatase-like hydrolase/transferase [Lentimicrobiaceae bacterium]
MATKKTPALLFETTPIKALILKLLTALLLLSLSRMSLYFLNIGRFSEVSFGQFLYLFFVGLRFDLFALVVFNAPFILMQAIPFQLRFDKNYQRIAAVFYVLGNAFALMLNLIDTIYFRFIDKRSTSELFQFFGNSDENIGSLLGQFFIDFWYMFLIFIVLIFILYQVCRRIKIKNDRQPKPKMWYLTQTIALFLIFGLSFLAIRGGFQLKPIGMIDAAKYASIQHVPLVLNTPFTVVKTIGKKTLTERKYFSEEKFELVFSPIQNDLHVNRFVDSIPDKPNVVVLILESFGQELIGYYNATSEKQLTPFLDSLLQESLTFEGFANGRRSIEALPSILAGIPSLMEIDFTTSIYAGNNLTGLGSYLKSDGYTTAFFHGGNNGTMNFDSFSRSMGFDAYFGRSEFGDDTYFDGRWGIFDDPFLQFTANELNNFAQPFGLVLFTLSSHHPYTLPEGYVVENETLTPFEKTVCYADVALKHFFETASKMPWFDNTIFVITADHVHSKLGLYNSLRMYSVPLAFYAPNFIQKKRMAEVAQHTDILPSLAALLQLDEPVFSYGRNVFDTLKSPFFVNFINQFYQYFDGTFFIRFDGNETTTVFDVKNDSLLKNNILKENNVAFIPQQSDLKAIIQSYTNRMVNNKLFVE